MRYVFAECVLDTQLHTLHRAGMAVRLRPKVFHVLRYLLEHGDHVVSMDELCTHVWPGQFISDATIEADPTYALAYSGLADAYTTLGYGSYLAPEETFPHAKHAAVCALTLDARLAEPHTSLAYVKLYYEWDWAGAERAFQQAIALNPHYATAHHWYSVYLTAMERPDEARREIQRAHELDPLSLIINTDMGFALYYTRQYDQAIAHLRTTLEMNRQFPLAHLWLGRAYQQQGKYAEAIAAFQEAGTVLGEWPVTIAAIGYVYGVSGHRTKAHRVLEQLRQLAEHRYVTSYGMALVYAGLGEHDHAFAWLQKALEERTHWLVWLKLDPRWDGLCADPRFVDLQRRVGLLPSAAVGTACP